MSLIFYFWNKVYFLLDIMKQNDLKEYASSAVHVTPLTLPPVALIGPASGSGKQLHIELIISRMARRESRAITRAWY